MTYNTTKAAEDLLAAATRDTWSLADAILADVPALAQGKQGSGPSIEDRTVRVVEELEANGITTPDGNPYTVAALLDLRKTAHDWTEATRHGEAAYETHREASRKTHGRDVLALLCSFARGEDVDRPDYCDPAGWTEALEGVEAKRSRRFPVGKRDVRAALSQATGRIPKLPRTSTELLHHLASARDGLRAFADVYRRPEWDAEIPDTTRDAIARSLRSLVEAASMLLAAIDVRTSLDDDALSAWLAEESDR